MNLPNALTVFRILLVIPMMILVFMDNLPAQIATIVIFVIASLTDDLDGYLARKNKQITDLGIFLDPLADKMLISLTFLALVSLGVVPLWMFAVIIVRDLAVDGMRMMSAKKGVVVPASIFGKMKTATQMITISSILVNRILELEPLTIINNILLYIVVALTILSGLIYIIKGRKLLK